MTTELARRHAHGDGRDHRAGDGGRRCASDGTPGIVTLEEHTLHGGRGTAVLEAYAIRGWRTPILPLALDDAATSIIGSQEWPRERARLSTEYVHNRLGDFARTSHAGLSLK